MSDGDILLKARMRCSQEVGAAFNHEHCWQLVKDIPQWTNVPTMSTSRASKRSKTYESSDAHFTVDDDEDDEQGKRYKNLDDPSGEQGKKMHQRVI